MIDLSKQTALVIGEINQLAEGVAASLSLAGARLILVHDEGNNPPTSDHIEGDISVHAVSFSKPDHLARKIAVLPPLDTVVINPGWFAHAPFLDATAEEIDQAIQQNFEQATTILQAAAKHLIRHHIPGSIIALSSVTSLMPFLHNNLAGSTLAALEVVAKMAAVDLGQHGIRVNIIAAGWLSDERSQPLLSDNGQLHTPDDIPLGRIGEPGDVGNLCCFLASPLSRYMTGTVLPVDGGFLLTKSSAQMPYRQ